MDAPKTLLFDTETNGLLQKLDRIHVLSILEYETQEIYTFRRNKLMNNIEQGLEFLASAEMIVAHNGLHFDIPAIQKVYPGWEPKGRIRDSMVCTRLIYADQKQKDFMLFERGRLPGQLIGRHTLDAWGHRLKMFKGDYKAKKEAEAREKGLTDPDEISAYVWAEWNQDMEDYCDQDNFVLNALWQKILRENYSEEAIILEHQIHDYMGEQERDGIPFDREGAQALAQEVQAEMKKLVEQASKHYGFWYAPAKKRVIAPRWDDPDGVNKAKKYPAPDVEHGQDESRAVWGEVVVPKKTLNYKDPMKASRTEGCAYTPIQLKEFNPLSREQIIDRFITIHDWVPQDFTEKGRPSVNDDVLRTLIGKIPMAEELAEIFFHKKLLGQVQDGAESWLNNVEDDDMIRHYCNVGGTISGRASHNGPNLAQVPRVVTGKELQPDGSKISVIKKGRVGDYGWECRNLFYVPDPYVMLGTDMEGIEFRCLANLTHKYDDGALLDVVLHGDIHTMNQEAAGLATRDQAKTFIYAYIYGAGDWKLGHIANPLLNDHEKILLGRNLRRTFEERIPALGKVVKDIGKQARSGSIEGLDGRRLMVRGKHAALNLKLQSDAAILAKKWLLNFREEMYAEGLSKGWGGDWVQLLWIHDEDQIAILPKHVEVAKHLQAKAAQAAGDHFKFIPPVAVASKIGHTWAETH